MRRKTIIAAALLLWARSGWAENRPNIVLISADDLIASMTGFEGHAIVKTPHLDRLAAESVRFTRCYVPTPQGAPAQACILTGQYPHTHGVVTDGLSLPSYADTFTSRLKSGAYTCGIVGKWQLPWETAPKPGFGLVDFVRTDGAALKWNNDEVWVDGEKRTTNKFLTDWHTDQAIVFLDEFRDKPFFLWLSFRAPQVPLVYPPGTETLYVKSSIDWPVTMEVDTGNWPRSLNTNNARETFRTRRKALQMDRAQYYAMITNLDGNVGRLLQHVDTLGLRDKTVIVFTSDSGWTIGDHQLYGSGPIFFEEAVRVPLLVRYAPLAKPGTVIDRVVSQVDLAPTFCGLAGLRAPMGTQGASLLPFFRDPKTDQRANEAFFEYAEQDKKKIPVRGVVTQRFKLIHYLEDKQMLFDLKNDPNETQNAADIAQYKGVAKSLSNRLEYWRKQTKDTQAK